MRPHSPPAESHSFVGMARETAAMPPALILTTLVRRKEKRKKDKFYIYLDVTHTHTQTDRQTDTHTHGRSRSQDNPERQEEEKSGHKGQNSAGGGREQTDLQNQPNYAAKRT